MTRAPSCLVWTGFAVCLAAAVRADEPIQPVEPQLDREVSFYRDIYPILENKCLACHSAAVKESDLVLETAEATIQGGASGEGIFPGKPDESLVYLAAARIEEPLMPPLPNKVQAKALTPAEVGLLRQWILEGARTGQRPAASTEIAWQPIPPSYPAVYSLSLSPDRRFLAAGRGNRIFLYDLVNGQEWARLTDPSLLALTRDGQPLYGPGVAHRDFVHTLAFSPDGKYLASGGYRVVKLWQRSSPAPVTDMNLEAPPKLLALHPEGTIAAIGLDGGRIQLWNPATGEKGPVIDAGDSPVQALAVSTDGKAVLAGDDAGHVHVYSADEGVSMARWKTPAAVTALTFAQREQSTEVVTGHTDRVIRRWAWPVATEADTGARAEPPQPLGEISGAKGAIVVLAVLASGKEVAAGSADGMVRIVNLDDGAVKFSQELGASVTGVAFSADGKTIAASSESGIARCWSADGKLLCEVKGDVSTIRLVARLTDDQAVAQSRLGNAEQARQQAEKDLKEREDSLNKSKEQLATAEKELAEAQKKFDEAAAKAEEAAQRLADKPADEELKQAKEAADKAAAPAREERDKKQQAVVSAGRAVEIAEQSFALGKSRLEERAQTKQAEEDLRKQIEAQLTAAKEAAEKRVVPLRGVALNVEGTILTTAGSDGRIQQWNARTGAALDAFAAHESGLSAAGVAGDALVTLGTDRRAVAWEVAPRYTLVRVIGGKSDDSLDVSQSPFADRVLCVAFSPDGALLAAGGGDPSRSGELMLFDVSRGERVREFVDAHSDTVYDVEFSRDGTYLLSGAADKFVKLFDVASGKLIRAYEGHTSHVLGVAFQADGSSIASAGADNAIKVWNTETGEQRRTISNYSKQVTCIDFVGIGENLISASGDYSVKLHRASNGQNYRSFSGSQDYVYRALATADEGLVIAAGEEGVVRVWDGKEGKVLFEFTPPTSAETAAR